MGWMAYWAILRRRWPIIVGLLILDILLSGYSYRKAHQQVGYQSCLTLYVADVSSPSLIAAPSSTLQTAGQLLAGETAANFFADDILDVAQSRKVARYLAARVALIGDYRTLPNAKYADINGAISGSRLDRTVNLCVSNPTPDSAQAVARFLGIAMTSERSRFIGPQMAHRTYVSMVSPPSVSRAPSSRALLNLALRLLLGLLVALGIAAVWDALDPMVRDRRDVERALRVPVLGVVRAGRLP